MTFDELVKIREELGLAQCFSSGAAWFEWWLSDAAMEKPVDEDQMPIGEYGSPTQRAPTVPQEGELRSEH